MTHEEQFTPVLNEGEQIIKVYKPDMLKFWLFRAIHLLLITIVFAGIVAAISFMSPNEDPDAPVVFHPLNFGISFGVCAVILILFALYLGFYYRNLFYCVTTERVIIRAGVFGTDFKTMDMQMIGAIDAYVSLLDKIARHNTGRILFGSNSAPLVGRNSAFAFRDIADPYNEIKAIKSAIDKYRQARKNAASTAVSENAAN